MAIFSNKGAGPIQIAAGDTVIFAPSGIDRYSVDALNLHETAGTAGTVVSFYISPDLTSASGIRVSQQTLAANDEVDVNAIIGQGYETLNIIAVASAVGVVGTLTRTEYTGGS